MFAKSHRFILSLLAAVLLATLTFATTHAHAALIKTDPPDGTVLEEAPELMNMWFNEPVTGDFSTFRLLDINGQTFDFDKIVVDPADSKHVTLYMPSNMPDGVYSVNWSVHSSVDGHITNGLVIMGIGAGAELGTVDRTVEVPTPWLEVVLRWVNFTLLTSLTGAFALIYFILRAAAKQEQLATAVTTAEKRLLIWMQRAVALAWVVGFALLFYQAATLLRNLPEGATLWHTSWQIITSSRWGYLWLVRQLLLPIMAAFLLLMQRQPGTRAAAIGSATATLISLALLLLLSLNSHAAGLGATANIAIAVDWLHLIGVGVWLGSLLSMIATLIPILRQERSRFIPLVKATWGRFGIMAALSVGVIVTTGIYSTGQQVATFDTLLTTQYGQTISGKILLLVGMGLVGLLNAMMLHPRLARPLGWLLRRPQGWTPFTLTTLPRLVLVEGSVGVLILFAAGLVTALPNARGPQYITYNNSVVDSQVQEVDDLLISLSAKPNLPGSNVISIRASSMRRPEPAPVLRVFANLTYMEEDLGTTTVETNREVFNRTSLDELAAPVYRIGGSHFSLPGRWLVEVHVRRTGMEDTVAQFEWIVPATADPPRPIVSGQPLSPVATWTAVLGGALILLIVLILLGRKFTNRWRGGRQEPALRHHDLPEGQFGPGNTEPAVILASPRPHS